MATYLSDPAGRTIRDEELAPADFIKALYPDVGGCFASPDPGRDEESLTAARRGEYYREPRFYPKPELETLSATARLEKQSDRIERMLRYVIAKLPTTTPTAKE